MNVPDSRTSAKVRSSSGISGAYCALTSTSGIGGTASKSRGASSAQDQVDGEEQNSCNDRDLDVAEVVVELLVARAEPPADAGQRAAPDSRADEREHRVAPERDAKDPGGNRDERAHDRRDAAQEDRPVLVA